MEYIVTNCNDIDSLSLISIQRTFHSVKAIFCYSQEHQSIFLDYISQFLRAQKSECC